MSIPLILAVLTAPILAMAANHTSTTTPSLVTFIFGDSLTEVGNNNHLRYSLARSDFPFYGIDYTNRKPTGRFTNGRTIIDIISEKLGIPSPPPYLSLHHNDDAVLKGVNYASGGAGILNDTGTYFIQRMSFDDQIGYFENTTKVITVKIGQTSAKTLLHRAIYFIAMGTYSIVRGSNDYMHNFLQPSLPDGRRYTHEQFLEILSLKLVEQLTRLYLLGARIVIFHALGPLGCVPSERAKSTTNQCLRQVNEWVVRFNYKVQKLIKALNFKLKKAQFIFADTYQDGLNLIENPSKYGFKVSNRSCCAIETAVGGLCLSYAHVCANRSEYVFWDAFHPSDAANVVLVDRFFSKLFDTSNSSTKSSSNHIGYML
ncbi:hypothetical protein SSX86_019362 [Deinandra increscens subsp. villosa]|uniref:Uncharacterized protein n=1 Tax=Deinandra increscens subsp. villosa TaxID=3103831 RepID=A0AAP0GUH7_9ASTR